MLVTTLLALSSPVAAAPKRPSNSATACSLSTDKFNEAAAKNPSGAEACRQMADAASKSGGSFAFMCDGATGEVSCCDDSSCVSLGSAAKQRVPSKVKQLPKQRVLQKK
jgi:hypothetical protein